MFTLILYKTKALIGLLKTEKVRCLSVEDLHEDELQLIGKLSPHPSLALVRTSYGAVICLISADFND